MGILGFMQFLNLKVLSDATLTILTTTGAIAVDLWGQSRSGRKKPSSRFPILEARANH